MAEFKDLDIVAANIAECLKCFGSDVESILNKNLLRLIWFQFTNMKLQKKVMREVTQHLKKKDATWENTMLPLIRAAAHNMQLDHDEAEKIFGDPSNEDLWNEIQRTTEQKNGFVLICTEPSSKTENRRMVSMTITSEERAVAALSEFTKTQKGVNFFLLRYKERLESERPWPEAQKRNLSRVLYEAIKKPVCRVCKASDAQIICSLCETAHYCSEECKSKDSKEHDPYCSIEKSVKSYLDTL